MPPANPHARRAVLLVAAAAAAVALVGAFLSDRRGGIDEIGLVNPPYMKLHYGRMTYPVHGHPESMFVHPPTHYQMIAACLRAGFSLYYAEAMPTFLTVLLCIFLIARGPLPDAVRIGLLYGMALASVTFNRFAFENYGMRPEHHLAVTLLAGLILLEWARIDHWSGPKLFAGAALVVLAAGMQYYAWPAVLAVCVYGVFLLLEMGWGSALSPLAALTAGALTTGLPYLTLFVLPNAASIRGMLDSTRVTGAAAPFAAHLAAYRALAGLHVGPGLAGIAFRLGIPMAFLSGAVFLAMRSTRVLILAALPVQLSLLFFAWHKHAYYYYPEIQFYCAAIVAASLAVASSGLRQRHLQAGLWYAAAIGCAIHLWIAGTAYRKPHWTLRPEVHELEVARAAGREMLGPAARVGSRIGAWYASGGAYWHRVSPDLFWNPLPPAFDPAAYLARFDAIAEYQHMSFETRNGRSQNAATWYAGGLWHLRGFFFAGINPEISYLLFAARPAAPLTGFGLRDSQLYRFTEDSAGDREFISLACHLGPGDCTVGEGKSVYLDWPRRCPWYAAGALFTSMIFLPEQPGRFEMDAVVNVVLPADQGQIYPAAHPECRLVRRTRGILTRVDEQQMIARLRREDRPMQFYEEILDMPGVPRIIGEPPPPDAIRIDSAVRLENLRPAGGQASVVAGTPVRIVTPRGMGAYAASIPIDAPARAAPCWIHFRVTVSKGRIGLGILNRATRGFVTEPPVVPAGKLPVDVYIALPSTAGADAVIVRSAEAESESEAALHAVDLWMRKP